MKKIITLFTFVFLASLVGIAQKTEVINLSAEKSSVVYSNQSQDGLTLQVSVGDIHLTNANTKGGEFVSLSNQNLMKIYGEGQPNIPVYSNLIEIPQDAKVKMEVVSYNEEIVKLADYSITSKIMPAQPSISKSDKPENLPFYFNEDIYSKNGFINKDIAIFEESGTLRHTRLGRIEISPIQYNPAANELRVLNNLVVNIKFEGANHAKTLDLKRKYHSPYFGNIMQNIPNYVEASKELITATPATFVIVSDPMFEAQLQEYVAWKELKGFHVIQAYTDDIGTSTDDIKNYLQNLYTNPATGVEAPSFVLFVGDVAQIPVYSGLSGSHVSDLYYLEYTGDNLPEVYYGRFSAQNTAQLQPQIDKSLEYEKFLMPDASYLERQVLVAGVDGSWAPTHGNGAINYATDYYCNADNGIVPLTYLYNDAANSTVMASNDPGASSSIHTKISEGVGFANYTAHCGPSGWSDPSFTTSDVYNLNNIHKYGLWIGNCCLSVKFDDNECFGEAALRAEDEGAIGDIGGSNSTYWNEDYWWGVGLVANITANPTYEETGEGVYDGSFHTGANEVNDPSTWFITQGQFNMCGNLAVEASTSDKKLYYWEIYHLMGDPSIIPYTKIPDVASVSLNPGVIMAGMTSLEVTTEPNAYVALSQNGTLVAAAMADGTSGVALLEFEASALAVGTPADIVITGQNIQPYIGTVDVTPSDQPYVVMNEYTTSAAPDYGTTINLSMNLKNVAASGSGFDASGVVATIETEDPYITILDDNETYGDIVAGDSLTIADGFQIMISDTVPDQHVASFNVVVTGTDKTDYEWISSLKITCNAPIITIGELEVTNDDDGNGRVDPGETADLIIYTSNIGHAACNNPWAWLRGDCAYLTITDPHLQLDPIAAATEVPVTFEVVAHEVCPQGTTVELTYTVSEVKSIDAVKTIVVGQPPEVVVGNGTSVSNYYPFYTYYENNRSQMLYLGSEIGAGDMNIQEIAFDFAEIGAIPTLTDLVINFKQTDLTALGNNYEDMTGVTEVFSAASYTMPTATGWHNFDIDDFNVNTNQNLIIEVVWGDNGAWDDAFQVNCTDYSDVLVTYGYADSETPPAYDGNSTSRPNMKFFFEEQSPGMSHNVEFTVLDDANNNPIPEATVMVGSLEKTTDVNGKVDFNLIEADYSYLADAYNYASETDAFTVDGEEQITITLNDNEGVVILDDYGIKVFPVPTKDFVNVISKEVIAEYLVYDMNGRLIARDRVNRNVFRLDFTNVANGEITLRMIQYKAIVEVKILVLH